MDTQTQIERLIELAIVQRTELKELVAQLPQLREHLNAEIERTFDEAEPQLRAELEEFVTRQANDENKKLSAELSERIDNLAKSLQQSAQAKYSALVAERDANEALLKQAEQKIADVAAGLSATVKELVTVELARFPRAGEIDQLRKEFAEPKGLNPRGKWLPSETYNRLDLVTYNGDSFTSAIDNNRSKPSRNAAEWTLIAARGTGGGGPTSLSELTTVPSNGDLLIGSGTSWVTSNLTAGAGISITVGAGEITISATDGDITLDDGTAASPSLHFTNDPDTGIYRPAANTLGISVSGTQVAYFDQNGLTVPSAGVVAGGSIHASNGNANNPSLSFSSDQDTGFFRHQPNEIGIALGGTQYGTWTSTTFSITPVVTMASSLRVNGTTDSSSKDSGAIVTEGGLGVEKSASIGGNLTVSGTGTSSVAGPWKIKPATNTSQLILEQNNASANWNIFCDSTTGGLSFIRNTSGTTYFSIIDSSNATIGINTTISGDLSVNNVKPAAGYSVDWGFGTSIKRVTADGRLQLNSQNGAYEFTGTGAVTLAGNLTVSGTGGVTLSYTSGGPTAPVLSFSSAGGALGFYQTSNTIYFTSASVRTLGFTSTGLQMSINGSAANPNIATDAAGTSGLFAPVNNSVAFTLAGTEVARFAVTTGNFLIGSPFTDGGQKLQVNGTAYVSGNATFGGVIISNSANDQKASFIASASGTYGSANYIRWYRADGTTARAYFGFGSGNDQVFRLGTEEAGDSLRFETGAGTTALTLDSSQNATFAGKVTASGLMRFSGTGSIKGNAAVSVSTSATTFYTMDGAATATWIYVFGDDGSAGFADLIVTIGGGTTPSVINSSTMYGVPPTRTYTTNSTSVKLALSAGTFSIRSSGVNAGVS